MYMPYESSDIAGKKRFQECYTVSIIPDFVI